MSKRAILYSKDMRRGRFVPFREIDDLLAQLPPACERLTPIRAKQQVFRMVADVTGDIPPSQATLSAAECRANAGVADQPGRIHRARQKVRAWPHIVDDRAVNVGIAHGAYCPLTPKRS